jgi:branched-chain amino acid transport system substrate-binding protein
MTNLKKIYATLALSALASVANVQAQDTIKLGISAPMSGAAAVWGLGMEWTAKQAAEKINLEGGVTVGGKKYNFAVVDRKSVV